MLVPLLLGQVKPVTSSEKALFTARRKEAYEALHPETKREATLKQNAPSRQLGETADRFTADTANKTGESERTVQRNAERGEVRSDRQRRVSGAETVGAAVPMRNTCQPRLTLASVAKLCARRQLDAPPILGDKSARRA